VDPTLVATSADGYAWRNVGAPLKLKFAQMATGERIATVEVGGRSISFGLAGMSSPSFGSLDGDRLTYANVMPGVDLVYISRPHQLKEFIVLHEAPRQPVSFRFPLSLDGLTPRVEEDGSISLLGTGGKVELFIPAGWMTDSAHDPQSAEPAFSEDVDIELTRSGDGHVLTVTPDLAWLQDPKRVYPVEIDPTLTKSPSLDTFVQTGITSGQAGSDELKSGTFDSGSTKARSFVKFDLTGLMGKEILSATFSLQEFHSWSCTASQVNASRVEETWGSGVNWANQPTAAPAFDTLNVAKGFSGSCPAGRINFDAQAPVENWTSGNETNYGIRVRANDETANNGWKKFRSEEFDAGTSTDPRLEVTYNTYPDDVTGCSPATNTISTDTTPTLSCVYNDDDAGDVGHVDYQICTNATCSAVLLNGEGTLGVDPGDPSPWTLSGTGGQLLTSGTEYWWRARSDDGRPTKGPWSGIRKYTPNQPPATPTLEAPSSGTISDDTTPTLEALYSDPDAGDQGRAEFRICSSSDCSNVLASGLGSTVAPEAVSEWTLPTQDALTSGQTYWWSARGVDSRNVTSSWSSAWTYTVDTDPPEGALLSPANGSTVSGMIELEADPDDGPNGSGVTGVSFYATANGIVRHVGTDTSATNGWSVELMTTNLPDGRVDLSATYVDAVANLAEHPVGAGASVIVDNGDPSHEPWEAVYEAEGLNVTEGLAAEVGLGRGDLSLSSTDVDIARGGLPVVLGRTYSSSSLVRGLLGLGWRSSLEEALTLSTDGTIVHTDGVGRERTFSPQLDSGLVGEYYDNETFQGPPSVVRTDANISFDWGTGPPAVGMSSDHFSVRWTGLVDVPAADTWTFHVLTGDRATVLVDGIYVLDSLNYPDGAETGTVELSPGLHSLEVRLAHGTGSAAFSLAYEASQTGMQVIPEGALSHGTGVYDAPSGVFETLEATVDGYELRRVAGTTTAFGSAGLLTGMRDRNGNAVDVTRDAAGRPVLVCYDAALPGSEGCTANTAELQLTYSTAGLLEEVTDKLDREWTFTQDGTGRMTGSSDPGRGTLEYAYDESDRLITVENAVGAVAAIAYDDGRVVSVWDPESQASDGPATTFEYTVEENEAMASSAVVRRPEANASEPIGAGTEYVLGATGEATAMTDPVGNDWLFTYDADHNILSETDPAENATEWTYDDNGLVLTREDPDDDVTNYVYRADGYLLEQTTPLGYTTEYTLDAAGNTLSEISPEGRTTTYTYDAAGNVLTQTNGLDHTSSFEYDNYGNLTSEIDALGRETEFTYDAVGNLLTEETALGKITQFEYDPAGRLVRRTDPGGAETTYTYDEVGRETTIVDPVGNSGTNDPEDYSWTAEYDLNGREAARIDALGHTTTYSYDWNGNLISQTDPLGNVQAMTYDAADRLIEEEAEPSLVRSYVYDELGRRVETTSSSGVSLKEYDLDGNVVSETDVAGHTTTFEFDDEGRLVSETSPAGNEEGATEGSYTTSHTYDDDGLLLTTTDPEGGVTERAYDEAGQLVSITLPNGATTQFEYDAVGRTTRESRIVSKAGHASGALDAQTMTANIGVTADGEGTISAALTSNEVDTITLRLIDGESNTVATAPASQDGPEMLSAVVEAGEYTLVVTGDGTAADWQLDYGAPSIEEETFTYDQDGRVTEYGDAHGNTDLAWNDDARVVAIDRPDGVEHEYDYDAAGRLTEIESTSGDETFEYDEDGRLLSAAGAGGVYDYEYDAASNETAVSSGESEFAFEYDEAGRVTTRVEGSASTDFTYDGLYPPITVTHPTGEVDERGFDDTGNLMSLVLRPSASGAPTVEQAFAYDAEGQLVKIEDASDEPSIVLNEFEYDERGLLLEQSVRQSSGLVVTAYSYDENGNRLTETSSAGTATYAYDGELLASSQEPSGAQTIYLHDGAGNLTREVSTTARTAYSWTAENRLASVEEGGAQLAVLSYDAKGLRSEKTSGGDTTSYSWDRGRLATIDADGTSVSFDYDASGAPLSITIDGATYLYRLDGRGSVVELTDAVTHAPVVTYRYDFFGRIVEETGLSSVRAVNPFTFRAAESALWDADLGLYTMDGRVYDPTLGRYISAAAPVVTDDAVPMDDLLETFGGPVAIGEPGNSYTCSSSLSQLSIPGAFEIFKRLARAIAARWPGWTVTDREFDACTSILHPRRAYQCVWVYRLARVAVDAANNASIPGPLASGGDGKRDAFRHCYWAGMMTQRWDAGRSRYFSDLHEYGLTAGDDDLGARHFRQARAMDLHNNAYGRVLGDRYSSRSGLRQACLRQARPGGELWILGRPGRYYLLWPNGARVVPDRPT
jgi:YD repeat-containing protein